MKRDERLGCLLGTVILVVIGWVTIYWGTIALENVLEIVERIGS